MRLFMTLLLTVLSTKPLCALGWGGELSPSQQCRVAIAAAERGSGMPERLMRSIGIVESGRRDETGTMSAWPWTINAEGVGSYFPTKAEAIAAVNALRARGVRSIDVGCMQVNLVHHAEAFSSLEEAFDPGANARYAARFLQRLFAQTGSWPGAAAGYHSLTPEIGEPYARRVLALMQSPDPSPQPGLPAALFSAGSGVKSAGLGWSGVGLSAGSGLAMGNGSTAHIIRLPVTAAAGAGTATGPTVISFSAGSGGTGRGLDSYRANPVFVMTRFLPKPG